MKNDQATPARAAGKSAGKRQTAFLLLCPVIFPFIGNDFLCLLPLIECDDFLTGDLRIFYQFSIGIVLISGIERLFCNVINAAFIEENLLFFSPSVIAFSNDGTV